MRIGLGTSETTLKHTQTYPLWDSTPGQELEGCQSHTGSEREDWIWGDCQANSQRPGSSTDPSLRPPPTQSSKVVKRVAPLWPKTLTHSFTGTFYRESKQFYLIHRNKHREAAKLRRQRNMAQMKEQNKTPEKELNEMEIANLSDAEFKTLVIRILKELIEYGNNIKEEMKITLSEIKISREPTVKGRKLGVKSMVWNMRKK